MPGNGVSAIALTATESDSSHISFLEPGSTVKPSMVTGTVNTMVVSGGLTRSSL